MGSNWRTMSDSRLRTCRLATLLVTACLFLPSPAHAATLQPQTVKAWDTYVQFTEKRIASELDGQKGFLIMDFKNKADADKIRQELQKGKVHIERMTSRDDKNHDIDVPDGAIHHWYGAIFVPKTDLQHVLRFVQSYDDHYRYFKEVEKSRLLSRQGDTFNIYYRFVRSKLSVTAHYNTNHTAMYRTHDSSRVSSRSVATRITELENVGSKDERERKEGNDSGFLWRLNSYWRFREADGGVYIECESMSLSRSVPWPLGYVPGLKGVVESLPRESMENTLTSIRDGLKLTS
jgi:hypothetical protein